MKIDYAKTPYWVNSTKTAISLVVKFEHLDFEVPFTATPDDPEEHGREIYNSAISGKYGEIRAFEEPTMTIEELKGILIEAVQEHMDKAAQSYGYDDIKSAVTYADETSVQKFSNEGKAFRKWRSLVWDKFYQISESVNSGVAPVPTKEELIASLPLLDL